MTTCLVQASATIELYFYDELSEGERNTFERHLTGCEECRRALEELAVIRKALDARPTVTAPAGGDWSGFMDRLDAAVRAEETPPLVHGERADAFGSRRVAAMLAMAALLVLVTLAVFVVLRNRRAADEMGRFETPSATTVALPPSPEGIGRSDMDAALAQISEQHLERCKLVVLGLATKDPLNSTGAGWDYERTLASSLLSDTRLYRQTAEERGMKTLAGVLRDLELVLLQTSMSETPDGESLEQLQRLIRRRDLITKMDVVASAGLLP